MPYKVHKRQQQQQHCT